MAFGNGRGMNRQALLALAALCALLAAWWGWTGVRQWRDDKIATGLQQARDGLVEASARTLGQQAARLEQLLKSAPAQAALAGGDAAAIADAVHAGWKEAHDVQALPADLAAAYADPAAFGYAKLALLEAAQREQKAVARVVREGKQPQLGVAAAAAGHVVYAGLPLALLTDPVAAAAVSDKAYLALRQGNYTVVEHGDNGLSANADVLSRPVGDTGLRVAAALPEATTGPFGLGAIATLVLAAVLAAIAVLAALVGAGKLSLPRLGGSSDDDGPGLSLDEALQSQSAPEQPVVRVRDERAERRQGAEAAQVEVDAGIFRAYDIRGVVGETLSPAVAELIGMAIGSVMEEQGLNDIVVGRDGRLSGPSLSEALIEGLRKSGRDVIDIGLAPTPVAYFAAYHLRAGSCVAVTGSHNPPDYNGFKIVVGGQTLSGAAITDLYSRISENRLHLAQAKGSLQQRDVADDYIRRIADDVQMDRPLKVVVDAGNGVAGDIAPRLLEAIGANVIPLYCEVDGTFPNHHPDPSEPHNLDDLVQTVKRFDADIGLAFDGDGDRLGVVTREGEMVFPDRVLMLFAADVLERNPGALVIYDVKCTGKLQSWILRYGGTPLMWQTGHSLIKAKMRETGAELAGEMSGHFFFQERWYGFDDGLYSAARLLEILAVRAETPSEVIATLPSSVSTPEIKVPVDAGSPHAVVREFVEQAQFDGSPRLSTIDGLRVDWDDGWGLVRASNTTPILVLRFEADDKAALERIKSDFRAQLQKVAPGLPLTF
ncbi:phosphomannomutase/phosphoglucomutase [Pseudoxanthomonas sangjuensis]|uniref:phosphomannomutase/phosphoglucomutase n=1 Tax=Pseudoxanthomonas sangjuensis TaxID=1503750 RepID=UPI001390BB69|nr:phosphomannomutase [Pseudoxanthomonas sangjuensis]